MVMLTTKDEKRIKKHWYGRESDTKQAKPIFIRGMDRSGTSLLGQMVLRWGAFGGDLDQLSRGDRFNPAGYFENRALQSLFRQVFRGRIPTDDTYLETMREKAQHPEHRALVANLVDSMSSVRSRGSGRSLHSV